MPPVLDAAVPGFPPRSAAGGAGPLLPPAAAACVAGASTAALAALAARGWLAPRGIEGLAYCERLGAGLVAQPANTWSNAGFVAAAFAASALASRDAARPGAGPRSRVRESPAYGTLYAALAAFLGPASAAMHASTTAWGGRVDVLSMVLWIAFPMAFGAARLARLSTSGFLAAYAALAAALGTAALAELVPGGPLFACLVAALCLVELAVYLRARPRGGYGWLATAGAAYTLASIVWLESRTGEPLCAPASLWQGHAAWHLLCAGAVLAYYQFYRNGAEAGR